MRQYALWISLVICLAGQVRDSSAQKVPLSNYPTVLILAGRGPDAQGNMNETRILQRFTIIEQPKGKGDYISNDFKDAETYRFDMAKSGGLRVLIYNKAVRNDAQWTLTSTMLMPHHNYTVLSGTIADFKYGGPKGVSSARLVTDCRGFNMDRTHAVFRPGAYQGFLHHKEANGRLYCGTYQLTWYHAVNMGVLKPIP